MENQTHYAVLDVRKLLFRIWQNKYQIVIVTLAMALLGFLYSSFLIRPIYTASAEMVVNNRSDGQATTITQSDLTASSNLVETYAVILKSHTVMEQVIRDCNLPYTYSALGKKINISSVGSTAVMKITVRDESPDTALAIVTDLVRLAPAALINGIEAGSVTTVDEPWTDRRPVSPNIPRNTALAALLGLMACMLYVLIKEITDDKFKTANDVRSVLDLNVLSIIPLETPENRQGRNSGKRKKRRKSDAGNKQE